MDDDGSPVPCCFDEWASHNAKLARKKETVAAVTGALLAAVREAGLDGRTVLDVGCGTGDLALATVAHGASSAMGIDLGSGAIDHARRLARARGLEDRTRFEVGDGTTAPLPPSDVVVLNRVVCCYPNVDTLLDNTLGATRSVYALTAPADRGAGGWYNRVFARIANAWYAVRRAKFRGFRVFIHDLDAIDARVRAAGFSPVFRERRRIVWEVAVYTR